MKQILTIIFLSCTTNLLIAQPLIKKLSKDNIPKQLSYKGNLVDAIKWQDKLGDHFIIRAETGITANTAGSSDAELYAWHYILKNDSVQLLWKITDYIKECDVDLMASFIKDAFAVTDLDKDQLPEVWIVYETSCKGDVSPNDMKIIMYEGGSKYAMRGTRKLIINKTAFGTGEYIFDKAFKTAPLAFRQYAQKMWKKNMIDMPVE